MAALRESGRAGLCNGPGFLRGVPHRFETGKVCAKGVVKVAVSLSQTLTTPVAATQCDLPLADRQRFLTTCNSASKAGTLPSVPERLQTMLSGTTFATCFLRISNRGDDDDPFDR